MYELNALKDMVRRRDELSARIREESASYAWPILADAGLKVEAVIAYRNQHGCSLADAKKIVEIYGIGHD